MSTKRQMAWTALVLLVPAPSLGAWAAFYAAPGFAGQAAYFLAKLWIAAFPIYWHVQVERRFPSSSPLAREERRTGLITGVALGALFSGAMWLAWRWFGDSLLDVARLRAKLESVGISTPARYIAFGGGLALANSLVEEYVWRWFVWRRCATLLGRGPAVFVGSALFTVHHVIAFSAQFEPTTAALASAAVFVAGCAWSWCYVSYRSIWPGWVSHVIVDAVGLSIGWRVLFAGP